MVGVGTPAIFITFLLAILGYTGLTAVTLMSLRGRWLPLLWRLVAAIIVIHVIMVWTFRYHGEFALAVRNGYAGFAIFHSALAVIITSVFLQAKRAQPLVHLAFVIVSAGALGASFRYEAVDMYRIPVILYAALGIGALGLHYYRRLRPS